MTIPFEKLKARLLADPTVRAEYDALAPEFEIAAELVRARVRCRTVAVGTGSANGNQPVRHRSTGKRSVAAEHEDPPALR